MAVAIALASGVYITGIREKVATRCFGIAAWSQLYRFVQSSCGGTSRFAPSGQNNPATNTTLTAATPTPASVDDPVVSKNSVLAKSGRFRL
jgi:hypothetical protein